MKTKAVFSTATQTNSRNKEKQLHLLFVIGPSHTLAHFWAMPGLFLPPDSISCSKSCGREEKIVSLCLESQSPLNLSCYIQNKESFCPSIPPISSETNSAFSSNLEISLAQPSHCQRAHPLLSQCSLKSPVHTQVPGAWTEHSTDRAGQECSKSENKSL